MAGVPLHARRLVLLGLLATAAACGRMQAKTPVPVAALDMPTPPARLLIPVELPPPEPETPAPETAPEPPPAPSRPRETAPRPPATAAAPPATPAADAAPSAVLQTTPQASATEERVKALIASADSSLRSVSFRDLGANARAQYDAARSYIRQASDAVKAKNYVFAEFLANKASDLVRLLVRG
jgi:outer membrane biosynthesis protein TonB